MPTDVSLLILSHPGHGRPNCLNKGQLNFEEAFQMKVMIKKIPVAFSLSRYGHLCCSAERLKSIVLVQFTSRVVASCRSCIFNRASCIQAFSATTAVNTESFCLLLKLSSPRLQEPVLERQEIEVEEERRLLAEERMAVMHAPQILIKLFKRCP